MRLFSHSMYENICDGFSPILAYVSVALAVTSVILRAITLKYSNKKLVTTSNIVFGAALGMFLILFLLAYTINRGY